MKQAPSEADLWWGKVNQPTTPEVFDELYEKVLKHYSTADKAYVFDGYCGANPASRRNVRIVTELAWQHHFCKNMFIRPKCVCGLWRFDDCVLHSLPLPPLPPGPLKRSTASSRTTPSSTPARSSTKTTSAWCGAVFHVALCVAVVASHPTACPVVQGLNSPVFVAFNVEKRVAVIGGTWYGGEMKKGIFSMMNFWLPLDGIMAMHCSANMGKDGDTALFFGLSGTGKTTLSADPNRYLIGDDEHGWDNDGIFNFEGGCYAKTIDLSREKEPEVWDAIKPNALLENVTLDADNVPVYSNREKTENSRVSYPLEHIPNHKPECVLVVVSRCFCVCCP